MPAGDDQNVQPVAEEEDLDALWDDAPRRRQVAQQQPSSSSEEDSYFLGSGGESEDSATRKARLAAARLKDFGEEEVQQRQQGASGPAAAEQAPLLPSAAAAFTTVGGPPAFLDPEATRPLALVAHKAVVSHVGPDGGALPDPQSQNRFVNKRGQAAGEWDVSQMAPKLREEHQQEKGVITGAAVRYRTDDRVGTTISAAQIAMLGGSTADDEEAEGQEGGGRHQGPLGATGSARHPVPKGKATKPMGLNDFMEKGVGGAALPRKRQDRKDKEKDKRLKGQSTHANWKTEAEMALRQQYD